MQVAALEHPSARVRRNALNVLDHYANDESAAVFSRALSDPVPRVRAIALHGLSCERCRSEELCVADVVPALVKALESDDSARVRHDTVPILMRLAGRDQRAGTALTRAADTDPDEFVRQNARAALEGRLHDVRSRKAMRRRARRRAEARS
jgi:HEAT repeat protein